MTTRSWRHYITRPLSLGLVVGLCSLGAAGSSAAATWTVTGIDNSADVGRFASMAADADKKLHISYLDAAGNLRYASNKSGSWNSGAVNHANLTTGKVVQAGTALALDALGNPQINYYYNSSKSERGMRNIVLSGSAWADPSPLNGAFDPAPGQSSAIFHKGGVSHLVFVKNANPDTASFFYAQSTNADYSSWTTPPTQIDSANFSGTNSSIVVDSAGHVHVVGYNSTATDLFYYTNAGGSWVKTALATSPGVAGKGCTLAIDANNKLHLAYLETSASGYEIKYRYKTYGEDWGTADPVADAGAAGGFPSIKTDSLGKVHISYYYSDGAGTGSLRYATNQSGAWTNEAVDAASSADVGQYSSIALDSFDNIAIAYYDVVNSALNLATPQITGPPVIALSAGSLDFGSVNRWASSALPVTISNTGQATLNISSITLSGAAASQYSASSCNSVPAGGDCIVTVTLTPDSGGLKGALLAIASNDPVTPSSQVALSASSPWWITAQVGHGGSGGTISPAGQINVDPGQSQSFTITPLSAPFSLTDLLVDSVSVGAVGSYTFNNVSADHSMEALFVSPIRLVGIPFIYYASLQQAYDAMVESGTMQTLTSVPGAEALLVDQPVDATIKGGYEAGFTSQSGATPLSSITISDGNLTPDGLVLQ